MARVILKLVAACKVGVLGLLIASMAVNAQEWICKDGWDVAGWDVFPTSKPRYWIKDSLTACQDSCRYSSARCEFVVFNRDNGQCWPKTSWDNGGHGITKPESRMVACRMHEPNNNRKLQSNNILRRLQGTQVCWYDRARGKYCQPSGPWCRGAGPAPKGRCCPC